MMLPPQVAHLLLLLGAFEECECASRTVRVIINAGKNKYIKTSHRESGSEDGLRVGEYFSNNTELQIPRVHLQRKKQSPTRGKDMDNGWE